VRAREWTVAAAFGRPREYGIPELPDWRVERFDSAGIAFRSPGREEPFISAERPVCIRR